MNSGLNVIAFIIRVWARIRPSLPRKTLNFNYLQNIPAASENFVPLQETDKMAFSDAAMTYLVQLEEMGTGTTDLAGDDLWTKQTRAGCVR